MKPPKKRQEADASSKSLGKNPLAPHRALCLPSKFAGSLLFYWGLKGRDGSSSSADWSELGYSSPKKPHVRSPDAELRREGRPWGRNAAEGHGTNSPPSWVGKLLCGDRNWLLCRPALVASARKALAGRAALGPLCQRWLRRDTMWTPKALGGMQAAQCFVLREVLKPGAPRLEGAEKT